MTIHQRSASEESLIQAALSVDTANTSRSSSPHTTAITDLEKAVPTPRVAVKESNNIKAISSCVLYSFCSVSMILVNKSLTSRYVVEIQFAGCTAVALNY